MGKRTERLNELEKNIIAQLIEEYDIHTTDDIQNTLKYLLGELLKVCLIRI